LLKNNLKTFFFITTNMESVDQTQQQPKRLVDVPVTTPQEALQIMVNFLNVAQKRGAFTIDESAKIWECMKVFQQQ
jgi:hypothetical protein